MLMMSDGLMACPIFLICADVPLCRRCMALASSHCGMKVFFLHSINPDFFFLKVRKVLWILASTSHKKEYRNRGCVESQRVLKLSFFNHHLVALCKALYLAVSFVYGTIAKACENILLGSQLVSLDVKTHGLVIQGYRIEGNWKLFKSQRSEYLPLTGELELTTCEQKNSESCIIEHYCEDMREIK